jgi:ribulose-5-phosphate 4-epimerase/fuculose-1-phosphate aldolase
MVRIDLQARVMGGPPGLAPSVEAAVHAGIYRARPDAMAVIHAHAPSSTVVATLELDLPPVTEEAMYFTSVPRIPFRPSGSQELVASVADSLAKSNLVLVGNHGVFACGPSLRAVANDVLSLEAACRLFLLIRLHGEGLVPAIGDR